MNKIDGLMSSNNSHKTCALELFHLLDISHMSVTDLSPFLFSPKTRWQYSGLNISQYLNVGQILYGIFMGEK